MRWLKRVWAKLRTFFLGTTVPWLKKWLKKFNTYGPNSSDKLALASLNDLRERKKFTAFWPMTLVQVIGGKRWSIAFIRYQTPEPMLVSKVRFPETKTEESPE